MPKFIFNPLSGNFDSVLSTAAELAYDNTTSGLTATQTQAAIDEVESIASAAETTANAAIPAAEKGANNGVATLDAGGKIPVSQLPNSVMEYLGTWAASTNTPTLTDGTGNAGDVYIASDAGTVNFGAGNITFAAGDWVVYSGSVWQKSTNSNSVVSVNGQTGVVSLDTDDIAEGTALYFTDERAQDAVGGIVATSAKVSLTYNDGTPNIIGDIVAGSLVNADISASAAIDYTKLDLTGDIVNADINAAAAIDYSKLNLTGDIVNADINAAAAIDYSKLDLVGDIVNADINAAAAIDYSKLALTDDIVNADINSAAAIAVTKLAAQTVSRAAAFDASGFLTPSTTTDTELGYVSGARSSLQTQIDNQTANNARNLNWITNYGVEVNTTGYATYADAAGSQPVDGTGGSPNVTIARNTTSPLDGVADLEFVKDAANRQGQGFSYDFTIDSAYQASVQQITFNYNIKSGTYADGDLTVWIYDVTNAVLVSQPSGNSILSTGLPTQQGQCTVQLSSNSTSYRLIVHVTSTSASAYTLSFDNFSVGPQLTSYGTVMTDWAAYTPTTQGFGTITSASFESRRVGDSLQIRGKFTTGTVTATEARIGLPTGITSADAAKIPATLKVGEFARDANTAYSAGSVLIQTSTAHLTLGALNQGGTALGSGQFTPQNGSAVLANTQVVSFYVTDIPIAGWSSNTVISETANTRVVSFSGTQVSEAVTANVTNISFTVVKDSVSGFATNIYTVKVPGDYQVQGSLILSATGTLQIYKNGAAFSLLSTAAGASQVSAGSVLLPNLIVGDTISIRCSTSVTVTSGDFSIFMLQGPQQIAASNIIAFSANSSSTAATTSSPYIFTVVETNTHGAYNAANGKFTAPAPGLYHFDGGLVTTSAAVFPNFYKNGVLKIEGSQASASAQGVLSATFPLVTGDIIDIRPNANGTGNGGAATTYFSGFRIGGV